MTAWAPIPQPQLGEDPGHVGFDRALADEQIAGDLGIGLAADKLDQHLPFPLGELAELWRRPRAAAGEPLDQPSGERGRDQGMTVGRGPDSEQAAPRGGRASAGTRSAPALSASKTYSSKVEGSEHHDLGRDRVPSAMICRVASMPSRRGIRTSMSTTSGRALATSLTAAIPVRDFADDFELGLSLDEHADPRPHQRLVDVSDQDPGSSRARRQPGADRESPVGPGPRLQTTAQQLGTLG